MTETTIQDLMDALPEAFVAEKAAGVDSSVQFLLSGDKGGDWLVTIRDQQCGVTRERSTSARLTVEADAQDVLDMFLGSLDPMRAYMRGKVRFQGDMGLAMKLTNLFKVDAELYQRLMK